MNKVVSGVLTVLACYVFAACAVPGLTQTSMEVLQRAVTQIPGTESALRTAEAVPGSANPSSSPKTATHANASPGTSAESFSYQEVPGYTGDAYVVVNDNVPFFTDKDRTEPPAEASFGPKPKGNGVQSYEAYSELDELGRCGAAITCVSRDIMPTEKRGDISEVKPTGWRQKMYDFVDGQALYNRCHLLGYQLTAENANRENLITGTRYMNTQGMLPFENLVADYVKETGNHVLYRVTPVFVGDELLARGVLMEAQSVEDDGEGVEYCVFAYNVQPGVSIDYATGRNEEFSETGQGAGSAKTYILNTKTMRYHLPDCTSVQDMNPTSRQVYTGSPALLEKQGYEPCGNCRP